MAEIIPFPNSGVPEPENPEPPKGSIDLTETISNIFQSLETNLATSHMMNAGNFSEQGMDAKDAYIVSSVAMIQALLTMAAQYAASLDKTEPVELGYTLSIKEGTEPADAYEFFEHEYTAALVDPDVPAIYTEDWEL